MNKLAVFISGVAVGSAVTYIVMKLKGKKEVVEDEVVYSRDAGFDFAEGDEDVDVKDKTSMHPKAIEKETAFGREDYSELLKKYNPDEYERLENKRKEKEQYAPKPLGGEELMNHDEVYSDKPYVISPDEFDENFDYETVSLTYFADGVLMDDSYQTIVYPETLVGRGFAKHFGEYEDDSVFVRNDALKTDYEILKDLRTFKEFMAGGPLDE